MNSGTGGVNGEQPMSLKVVLTRKK